MSTAQFPLSRFRRKLPESAFDPNFDVDEGMLDESIPSFPSATSVTAMTPQMRTESSITPTLGGTAANASLAPNYTRELEDISGKLQKAYAAPPPGLARQIIGAMFARRNPGLANIITGQAARQRQIEPLQQEYGLLENRIAANRQRQLDELNRSNIESEIGYRKAHQKYFETQADLRENPQDKKVDEGFNAQKQRVHVYQRSDGSTYTKVIPEIVTQPNSAFEQQEMEDWLKKNPGKGPSDYAKWKAGLGPGIKFSLESGGVQPGPLNPKQKATAQAILEGRMAPPSSFALRTPYWQTVMGAVFEQDPQFSEQRAQLRKGYTVGSQSKEINAINTAIGHIGDLNAAIDALQNGDVRALNAVANRWGVETGKDPVTTFKTIVRRVGPEISKAYVGTGGSAEERGATESDFDPNLAPQQLKSNVGITAKLLRSKIASLENQWEQNRGESMPRFKERFIMPGSQRTLDALSPKGESKGVSLGADAGAQEGDRRRNKRTGEVQVLRNGAWQTESKPNQ